MALRYLGLSVSLKLQNRTKSPGVSVKYQYFCKVVSKDDAHIKDERQHIGLTSSNLDGSSRQTWSAAFTPSTPHDLQHPRASGVASS
jgi:hypothetical protein